ncbi:MAG: right-handed parallel beta-helix repeat-containing protein [Rikenellaceae bacterium]
MKKIFTLSLLLLTLAMVGCSDNIAKRAEVQVVEVESEALDIITQKWGDEFKHVEYPRQYLDYVVEVEPGESIQAAIDDASAQGGGVVLLKEGEHIVNEMIAIKSGVTIMGEGVDKSVVKEGSIDGNACFVIDTKPQIVDVILKDMSIIGENIGNVQGIFITGVNEARHQRIMFQNLVVKGWGSHGVHIKRTDNMVMDRCTFTENGIRNGLYHNLYFLYNKNLLQSDCDFSFPVMGKGCKYTSCEYVLAQRCVIESCKANGIQADNEQTGYFMFHKYKIANCGQVALWFPCEYYYGKFDYTENAKYAPQNVILNRCEVVDNMWGAMWRVVNGSYVINSHFSNKKIDMGLLKCEVEMEGSTFDRGNELYTDVEQWPEDVELLW